jgi:tRNA threonylcarbamoyladenosine biosynthesis protein TsaE
VTARARGRLSVRVPTAADMQALGHRLGSLVRAGDLLVLTGDLGAGKTTLTQGIGAALGVRGRVTSPTFVIARVHPSTRGGPPLVHVDAYRLGGWDEVEDLDLEASLDEAVTVVEWGSGLVEGLAEDRLTLVLHRPRADDGPAAGDAAADDAGTADVRTVDVTAYGDRWSGDDLRALEA